MATITRRPMASGLRGLLHCPSRALAQAPPNIDEIVQRLASDRSAPCPTRMAELRTGLTLSTPQITSELLRFARGERIGSAAQSLRPKPFQRSDRFKSKAQMLQKLESAYSHPLFLAHLDSALLPPDAPPDLRSPDAASSTAAATQLPPFPLRILPVLEWSNNMFAFLLKGAKMWRISRRRWLLAEECLANMNLDGRLR
uniref:Uncharacterized protein n=1 Tax=Coccolithus braarudii TaxID=221442 RepID=A0A7S0LLI6_9EUKA|mmetsp:Transcript_4703/g.10251  ORF Transcript_4703/g.10251 Transcript_4703/m.10251 type:complete len:199 (+) Transcript_4703:34-630(+)